MMQPARKTGILSFIGTEQNPIDVLDQQEQKVQYDKILQQSRNQELIKKAVLCKNSTEIVFAIIMTKFPGEITVKEQNLKRQLIYYFYEKLKVNILYDYFAPKLEPDYSTSETKPFGIALVLHGVDYMDLRQVAQMFSQPIKAAQNFIRKITWINDSNVLIVFFNPQIALAFIQKLTSNVHKEKVKIQEGASTQLNRGWFELNSYNIYGICRKLFARYATTLEIDIKWKSQVNRYTMFQNARKGLELYLLTKFQATEDFQKIMQQIQYESYQKSVLSQNRYFHASKSSASQFKFEQYIIQRNKLPFKLNFQRGQQKSIGKKNLQTGHQVIEILSQPNDLNMSFVASTGKYNEKQKVNQHDKQNTSMIEASNKENAMVNEAEENVIVASILAQLNQNKPEVMVNEDQDIEEVMIQQAQQLRDKNLTQPMKNDKNEEKNVPISQSENVMNLLKKMKELSSATSTYGKKHEISSEDMKLLLQHFALKDNATSTAIIPDPQKQTYKPVQKNQKISVPMHVEPKAAQNLPKKTQEKLKNNQQSYNPFLLNLSNQKNATQVKEQKKVADSVDNKGSKQISGNGKTQSRPEGDRQEKKEVQNKAGGIFIGKCKPANQGNSYQKGSVNPSLLDDDHYEPSSY